MGKKTNLRRGEKVGKFDKVGKATPVGIGHAMPGVTAARGTFVPVKTRVKQKRTG